MIIEFSSSLITDSNQSALLVGRSIESLDKYAGKFGNLDGTEELFKLSLTSVFFGR